MEKLIKLLQLDFFYSLRYEMVETAYRGTREGGDRTAAILVKNLDRIIIF